MTEDIRAQLAVGMWFDTPYENGCEVVDITSQDSPDGFLAFDSDGVICTFFPDMVRNLRPNSNPHM